MPTSSTLRVALGCAVLTVTAAAPSPRELMFPQLVLIRGPGLERPVVISHGPTDRRPASDTIVLVYSSLRSVRPRSPEAVGRRPYWEVAEFFDRRIWSYYDADGRLARVPRFEDATHFSRIYAPADGEPALWDRPVVGSCGAPRSFCEIAQEGRRLLEARGLVLSRPAAPLPAARAPATH